MQYYFTPTKRKRARRLTKSFLREIGVPTKLKAFIPLCEAIAVVAEFPYKLLPMNTFLEEVYKSLDMGYNYKSAHKDLSVCVEYAFKRGKTDKLDEYFGVAISPETGTITLKEFIATAGIIIRDKTERMRE